MKTIDELIINRNKLLMEYDTSKTLVENLTVITEAPNPLTNVIKSVSKNTVDDVIKSARGGIKTTAGKVITNADDLIKSLERNVLSAANVGKVRTGLMKSPSLKLADKSALIDDFVKTPTVYNKYKNMKSTDISSRFKAAGYPDDVAREIARKIRGQVGQTRQLTTKIKTALNDATQKVLNQGAKSWNWSGWLKWGLGIGLGAAGVYAIIQYLKEDGTLTENPEGTPEGGGGGGQTPGKCPAVTNPGVSYDYQYPGDTKYVYGIKNKEWYAKNVSNGKEFNITKCYPDMVKKLNTGVTKTQTTTPAPAPSPSPAPKIDDLGITGSSDLGNEDLIDNNKPFK